MNPTLLKRPQPEEDEEDLLRMQEEFRRSKQVEKPSVQIHKMKKRDGNDQEAKTNEPQQYKKTLIPERNFENSGRFTIDLDKIEEEHIPEQVLFGVTESNIEFLTMEGNSDAYTRFSLDKMNYSKEDGFPEVIDLSSYFLKQSEHKQIAPSGMSFFAAEFDRLHGHLEAGFLPGPSIGMDEDTSGENYEKDNLKRIERMNEKEIQDAREEIEEKLDPKLLEFLRSRRRKMEEKAAVTKTEEPVKKVSKFKRERLDPNAVVETKKESEEPIRPLVGDMIKNLEVLEEFADRKNEEKYNRLAADAVQLDFATKCARTMLPRQTQNAVRLFEILKFRPDDAPRDEFLEEIRAKIEEIKLLYLEEIKEGDKVIQHFANGMNPVVDGCWMLRPLRSVLDSVQAREGEIFSDDIDMCRLCLQWTVLLFCEKPSIFHSMVDPNDFYVRLAELYVIGPEVFTDPCIVECMTRLVDSFVIPKAKEGRLSLRLSQPVAGLDAFMPFYEDLLKKFEEFSVGHPLFTKILLIGAYLNNALADSMECKLALWSSRRYVIRETTATTVQLGTLIPVIKECVSQLSSVWEEEYYVQYCTLLSDYAASLRDGRVTRDRNGAVFDLAADEVGRFVRRHADKTANVQLSTQKLKEFDALVAVIKSTVKDVLQL